MSRGTTSADNYNGVTYLRFSKGRFIEACTEGAEGAISRTIEKGDSKGKVVYELHHGSITGRLVDINTSVGKFGRSWHFKIDVSTKDESKFYLLQLQASYPHGRNIISRLLNADLTQDVKLQGFYIEKDDKDGIVIYQHKSSKGRGEAAGELIKIQPYYTADGEHKLPNWKEVKFEGKTLWDKTDETNALIQVIDSKIKPALGLNTPTDKGNNESIDSNEKTNIPF